MIDARDCLLEAELGRFSGSRFDRAFRGRADPLDLSGGEKSRLGSAGEAERGKSKR